MLWHIKGALCHQWLGNIQSRQSCESSALGFLRTAKSHRDAPFAALGMAEQELVMEDEFANRDEMGLQPLTNTTETEDAAFWKYVIWTEGILGQVFRCFLFCLGLNGFAEKTATGEAPAHLHSTVGPGLCCRHLGCISVPSGWQEHH